MAVAVAVAVVGVCFPGDASDIAGGGAGGDSGSDEDNAAARSRAASLLPKAPAAVHGTSGPWIGIRRLET